MWFPAREGSLSRSHYSREGNLPSKTSGKLARWALTVQEMDVTIRHKFGKKNSNADALSHCPAYIKHKSLGERPSDVVESQVCSVEGHVKDQVSMPDMKEVAMHQHNDFDMPAMITYLNQMTKNFHVILY